jgi:prepilin-type N-terminal cleavage/methylation domain-containing protein
MRKAFTMIEIIFVIVIIGILAVSGMQVFAVNRDDSKASICAIEVGQLITEIGGAYTKNGYNKFKDMSIDDITNIKTDTRLKSNGIIELGTTAVDIVGVTYYCGGKALMELTGILDNEKYHLEIKDKNPNAGVSLKAAIKLRETYGMTVGSTRKYSL